MGGSLRAATWPVPTDTINAATSSTWTEPGPGMCCLRLLHSAYQTQVVAVFGFAVLAAKSSSNCMSQ